MKRWGLAIADVDTRIVGVRDSENDILILGEQYRDLPRSKGIVFYFDAEFDGDMPVDCKKRILGYIN